MWTKVKISLHILGRWEGDVVRGAGFHLAAKRGNVPLYSQISSLKSPNFPQPIMMAFKPLCSLFSSSKEGDCMWLLVDSKLSKHSSGHRGFRSHHSSRSEAKLKQSHPCPILLYKAQLVPFVDKFSIFGRNIKQRTWISQDKATQALLRLKHIE